MSALSSSSVVAASVAAFFAAICLVVVMIAVGILIGGVVARYLVPLGKVLKDTSINSKLWVIGVAASVPPGKQTVKQSSS